MCVVVLQADSQMSKDRQVFYDASLQYVFKIQEVQERKKFEFVEPVITFSQYFCFLLCDMILLCYFRSAQLCLVNIRHLQSH